MVGRCGAVLSMLLLGLGTPVEGQDRGPRDLRVFVIDSLTLEPIADVSVQVGQTTIGGNTDLSGRLLLTRVPPGQQAFLVERFGYVPKTLLLDPREGENLVIVLTPAAIGVPGVSVEIAPFEERIDSIQEALEFRFKTVFGPKRYIDYRAMQQLRDSVESTEDLLETIDGVMIAFHCQGAPDEPIPSGCLYFGPRRSNPVVYIDDKEFMIKGVGWQVFSGMPVASICRVELGGFGGATQLRVYSCTFMAQVLNGERKISPVIWEPPGS